LDTNRKKEEKEKIDMERSRTIFGRWRRKRSDAGRRRGRGLPPTNPKGVSTYFHRRGFKSTLLGDPRGAKMQFAKPLPQGGRKHVRVYEKGRGFVIREHIDRRDPETDPLGHLAYDLTHSARDSVRRVRKRRG
jgi:hypothetical protein